MSPSNNKMICHCLGVRESDIRSAINTGNVQSIQCVMSGTGAGTGCTACIRRISALLCDSCPQSSSPEPAPCVAR
ncbi:MAG: (2Fe-2S)-binding protein [Planctomycetaceae bacterium]|nr:(2Fe-2S)-binding protein [Planctomycetaceae bacterium]